MQRGKDWALALAVLLLLGLVSPPLRRRTGSPCRPPPPRRARTASGPCRRRTTPAPATASSTRSTTDNVDRPAGRLHVLDRREPRPGIRAASWSATRCTCVTPYPNILYALDLTQPGAPLKWQLRAEARRGGAGRGLLRLGQPRRRPIADGRIFFNTLDGHVVAVDAATGKRGLEDQGRRHQQGRDDDHGAAGRRRGRCSSAIPAASSASAAGSRRSTPTTGKLAWKAYNTGPDKDVLIGPEFKPFYDAATRARTSASRPGRRTPGSTAAAPSGAGSPTTPT